jgi:DNA-directed RNA polymerase subunit K/omega
MSDSEDYDIQDEIDDYEDSEINSIGEEVEDGENAELDVFEEEEEDAYIDLKFNNKITFDNFAKVMELSNANYKENDSKKKTTSRLTKYEKTKILGIRAQQLASGMPALIEVPKNIRDIKIIAEMELQQRKVPFIIKRPLPNKGCEYIKVSDLEYI